jgi:cobalt/nickel transport protein
MKKGTFLAERRSIMKKGVVLAVLLVLSFIVAGPASAHFGMVIPSEEVVVKEGDAELKELKVDLLFWHPAEEIGMELVKPTRFSVFAKDEETDLLDSLKPANTKGYQTWTTSYKVKKPGVYAFYMEPKPYWEPAEGIYIIHYTKTLVSAFGAAKKGWDVELGVKTEIVPVTNPFRVYARSDRTGFRKDNVFRGIVKLDGKPVPNAQVEIEYYNKNHENEVTEFMLTHTTADDKGEFAWSVTKAGWWGFAALNTSDTKLTHDGEGKEIELGAVLWIKYEDRK